MTSTFELTGNVRVLTGISTHFVSPIASVSRMCRNFATVRCAQNNLQDQGVLYVYPITIPSSTGHDSSYIDKSSSLGPTKPVLAIHMNEFSIYNYDLRSGTTARCNVLYFEQTSDPGSRPHISTSGHHPLRRISTLNSRGNSRLRGRGGSDGDHSFRE